MTSTASSSTTTPYRLVVDVAAADEATALAFQQLLAGRGNGESGADDAGCEVGRAKDSGLLREDFTSRDLVLLMANAGVLGATADALRTPGAD